MKNVIRMYIVTTDQKEDELLISYGYQNDKKEIYLAEDSFCKTTKKENEISEVVEVELSSGYSEVDPNEDIYMEFIKITNNTFKRIFLPINGSLCETIGSNETGSKFDINNVCTGNIETWTILSMEEIKSKINTDQEYIEEI